MLLLIMKTKKKHNLIHKYRYCSNGDDILIQNSLQLTITITTTRIRKERKLK